MVNPVLRFLASLRNLRNSGAIKTIDQAFDFAKREFGEIDDLFKRQIEQIFKGPVKKAPKPGEGGITSIKNPPKKETPPQESGTIMDRIGAASNRIDEILKEREAMYKPKPETSPLMEKLEKGVETLKQMKKPGMDLATGLTRTAARKILDRAGIQVPDKADPIDFFVQEFGADALMDVKNVAEEMIEIESMGKATKSIDEILEQTGMFNIKRDPNAPKGISNEELEKIKKEVDQEKQLKDFDPTDREPNAEGGINTLMASDDMNERLLEKLYEDFLEQGFSPEEAARKAREAFSERSNAAMGGFNRTSFALGGMKAIMAIINKIKKLDPMDAMKEVNEVVAKRGKYKNLDDDEVKKIFDETNDHIFERDVPADEFAVRFDDEAEKLSELAPKAAERFKLKQMYPGIDEEFLTKIIDDPDPQRKAEVLATLDQSMELMKQGKGGDEVVDILKQGMNRKKNSKGGLQYLMGL